MGEVINLRQRRKEMERDSKAQEAEQNRVAFGRTKTEKKLVKADKQLKERNLDGHKLTPDDNRPSTQK